ncbi:MAG: hypothetical protein EA362_09730 [Saprospirales bacterium]|nr:MAG: hypothetical protein EA362_09730 [Saprospirales bacterium]
MSVLVLERHPFRFQLMVYFVFPLMGLSGAWVLFLAIGEYLNGMTGSEIYLGWITGVLLVAISVFFIIRFMKKAPPVKVDLVSGKFFVGKKSFSQESIEGIDAFYSIGSAYFSFFEGSPGILIQPKENKEVILEDAFYKNMDELKWWLFNTMKGKSGYPPEVEKVESSKIDKKEVFWVKTSLFEGKSMYYLLIILAMLFLTGFQYYTSGVGLLTFAFLIMTLISYINFGNQTTFFGFTGKHFLVRNYLSRAHAENWKLRDIRKAIINRKGGVSYLIIEFKDYSYKNFMSIVLNKQDTDLLVKMLKDKRIEIHRMD